MKRSKEAHWQSKAVIVYAAQAPEKGLMRRKSGWCMIGPLWEKIWVFAKIKAVDSCATLQGEPSRPRTGGEVFGKARENTLLAGTG